MDRLVEIFGKENVLKDEPMSRHTTFRIGGAADFFVKVQTISQLQEAMRYLKKEQIPFYIVGNGSNLLVRDEGVRGVVLQLGERFSGYEFLHETPGSVAQSGTAVDKNQIVMVRAKAGSLLGRLGKEFAEYSLSGFEFASGIPGTLGGAVYMNAGAYGGETKDCLESATVVTRDGEVKTYTNAELHFSYRHSLLQENDEIVIAATFALKAGDKATILDQMNYLNALRSYKQPLEYPSCGSVFKRPTGHFVGPMLIKAGLQGKQIGGAQVSTKHAGFIVNKGGATATDYLNLIHYIQKTIKEKYGIALQTEVRIIGEE